MNGSSTREKNEDAGSIVGQKLLEAKVKNLVFRNCQMVFSALYSIRPHFSTVILLNRCLINVLDELCRIFQRVVHCYLFQALKDQL